MKVAVINAIKNFIISPSGNRCGEADVRFFGSVSKRLPEGQDSNGVAILIITDALMQHVRSMCNQRQKSF